jgi:succinate dehydrogenase (ubiquinone) membrane anchor subunit
LIKQQKPVLSSQVAGLSSQPGEVQVRHKHPIQWNYEHYVTIALMGLIPTALVAESPIVDSVLAVTLCTHIFWGLECVITDYVHGATLPKLAMGALYAVMALALTGLLYFNYKDIGISRAVKKVWAL